ncbi:MULTISPECIES: hypothetical protein [Dehalobacter]|jgi:heme/copper-type cytochrome/quinol oxidase subunit 3|uniref:DUF805 domain-containing protein n=1 Tax=Dehalobacter restrictus (strain DSM 9455 / PER-K23) TaxID=871738 RepID=A0ABM5PA49_DEHRP|nr:MULTISPECIES: hypothetical protein [Dehalobacter]AHF11491.1 hypothetical protein DEHRE_13875 [Dehalobacter restrictus DSM 9455]MDJ0305161.1 hypothetical protein [Dehalobacter sp.]OCZ53880.1 hypothetical protein A7D23_06165 [Dehalobacter sp. TeCB1]
MKTVLLPETRAGRWSVGLFIAFIALAVAGGIISSTQGNTLEYPNPINSPFLGTVIYLMFSAIIIASAIGLIAVKKHNEHSVLVYLSIPLGIVFLIGVLMLLIGNRG